ncbi:hypothetical protein ABPG77_005935 [Micractinium sp. CCAP 211/92]
MDLRQWARQWVLLARQEADLAQGLQQEDAKQSAPSSARGLVAQSGSAQLLRAKLDRQLAAAEALRSQEAAGEEAPGLDRRRQLVDRALAHLATASAAQLQELAIEEKQLKLEYEEAAEGVRQLLANGTAVNDEQQRSLKNGDSCTSQQQLSPDAAPAAAKPSSSLPPEVMAYDTFLRRHGPTGGWHPEDHAEFERILRACRGSHAHAAHLCAEQLGLLHSAADVEAHARWHEELQRLSLAKRLAVQRWRLARHAEQAALLEQAQAEADGSCEDQPQSIRQQEQQRRQQQREQQQAAVARWRAARDRAQQEAVQREAAEQEERRRREAAALQHRQQENRQLLGQRAAERQLAARKERRLAAEGSVCSGAGAACGGARPASALADPAARQRLKARNEQLLERRAAAARRHSQQAAEHTQRVEQLVRAASEQCQFGAGVGRDPARLLRATSAAALRTLAALSEERGPKDSGFIRHRPRRAAPSWCAGARLQ